MKGTKDAPTPRKGSSRANEVPPTFLEPTAKSLKHDKTTNEPTNIEQKGDEAMSDLDWMRRRIKQGVDSPVSEEIFEQPDEEDKAPAQASRVSNVYLLPLLLALLLSNLTKPNLNLNLLKTQNQT